MKKPKPRKTGKSGKNSEQSNKSKKKATAKASSPRKDAGSPSYEVTHIAVDEINVAGGRRQLSPGTVASLRDSIAVIGLRSPLTVCEINGVTRLVGGHHRLEAVKALGWKTAPVVHIEGGEKVARFWEISENYDRADLELTVLEESELITERAKLLDEIESVSAQNGQKGKLGRPKGGVSDAARKLSGKGTVSAKRKQLERAALIDGIYPEAKEAARTAGFADNQSKLLAIAGEPTPKAQLAKIRALRKGSGEQHDAEQRLLRALERESQSELRGLFWYIAMKHALSFLPDDGHDDAHEDGRENQDDAAAANDDDGDAGEDESDE
jgi:ParB-like nuclease domain